MLFSSITFLYYFLPIVLLIYFLTPKTGKNYVLLASSFIFYAWGEPKYIYLMLFSIGAAFGLGFLIAGYRGTVVSKISMVCSVSISLSLLIYFKYFNFLLDTVLSWNGGFKIREIALPIGISFYTFQILSYTIDLYWGKIKLQKNIFTFATYVMLFPQLIAGPIVRYKTVDKELCSRQQSSFDISKGITRFVIGLSKKVLIANLMGEICQLYQSGLENSVLFVWMYALAFTFQIYFDFSGYSDMAIGLSLIFGFHFEENFNYPYVSKNITEFFRRWHISLGMWFRDYLYIPLGGNRVSKKRQILNLLIVWMLTGLWHGAGLNFIAWGLYFAFWLILEKNLLKKKFNNTPITLLIVIIGWILFDAPSLTLAVDRLLKMISIGTDSYVGIHSLYYIKSYSIPLLIAAIGSTPYPQKIRLRLKNNQWGDFMIQLLRPVAIVILMLVNTAYLVDGSFNPFIYFRF